MIKKVICLCIAAAMLLCGCAVLPEQTETTGTEPVQSELPAATETEPTQLPTATTAEEPTTAEPTATQLPATEPPATQPPATKPVYQTEPEPTEGTSVYEAYAIDEPDGTVLGVVYNEPYDGIVPVATVMWIEGEYERAYVIPKTPGSTIALYALIGDLEGNLTREEIPSYVVAECEKDCVIYGSFPRPEGYPAFYLEITDPFGNVGGYELSYNGNTGTPIREYVVAEPAT